MAKILIIGATSAIAEEVARLHSAQGDELFLLGRNEERLRGLVREMGSTLRGFEVADFDDVASNGERVVRAVEALGGLDVAFIAHGWLGDQVRSEGSFEHAAEVIATNFTSVVSFVIPLANMIERQRGGSLVVLCSVAGDRGRPRNYTYGAAKGALTLYLQGVRSRLYATAPEARVVAVRLGPVDTPMTKDHPKNVLFAEPRPIARALVVAETRGAADLYLPWYWQPIMATVRNLPEQVFQRLGFLSKR